MNEQDYPPLPDLSTGGDIWRAILEWEGNQPGYTAMKSADKIDEVFATAFHDYAAAALAQQSARHAEELAAYELTVANLRTRKAGLIAACVASELGVQPVLWASYYGERLGNVYKTEAKAAEYRAYNGLEMPRVVPLYAAPQAQPAPMNQQQIDAMWPAPEGTNSIHALVRAVEAFHGIKEKP